MPTTLVGFNNRRNPLLDPHPTPCTQGVIPSSSATCTKYTFDAPHRYVLIIIFIQTTLIAFLRSPSVRTVHPRPPTLPLPPSPSLPTHPQPARRRPHPSPLRPVSSTCYPFTGFLFFFAVLCITRLFLSHHLRLRIRHAIPLFRPPCFYVAAVTLE